MASIKIRAKAKKDGNTLVKVLISHPMESGLRKDERTGTIIPAHYIQELVVTHNGTEVMRGYLGPGVSKNPYLSFKFNGGSKGDILKISSLDNTGTRETAESHVK